MPNPRSNTPPPRRSNRATQPPRPYTPHFVPPIGSIYNQQTQDASDNAPERASSRERDMSHTGASGDAEALNGTESVPGNAMAMLLQDESNLNDANDLLPVLPPPRTHSPDVISVNSDSSWSETEDASPDWSNSNTRRQSTTKETTDWTSMASNTVDIILGLVGRAKTSVGMFEAIDLGGFHHNNTGGLCGEDGHIIIFGIWMASRKESHVVSNVTLVHPPKVAALLGQLAERRDEPIARILGKISTGESTIVARGATPTVVTDDAWVTLNADARVELGTWQSAQNQYILPLAVPAKRAYLDSQNLPHSAETDVYVIYIYDRSVLPIRPNSTTNPDPQPNQTAVIQSESLPTPTSSARDTPNKVLAQIFAEELSVLDAAGRFSGGSGAYLQLTRVWAVDKILNSLGLSPSRQQPDSATVQGVEITRSDIISFGTGGTVQPNTYNNYRTLRTNTGKALGILDRHMPVDSNGTISQDWDWDRKLFAALLSQKELLSESNVHGDRMKNYIKSYSAKRLADLTKSYRRKEKERIDAREQA